MIQVNSILLHQYKPRPFERLTIFGLEFRLRGAKRILHRLVIRQPMFIKSRHKHLGLKIGHLLQRHDEVASTRYFEGALQAIHPLVAHQIAEARFAGRQYDEFGIGEVHLADFVDGQDAVF